MAPPLVAGTGRKPVVMIFKPIDALWMDSSAMLPEPIAIVFTCTSPASAAAIC